MSLKRGNKNLKKKKKKQNDLKIIHYTVIVDSDRFSNFEKWIIMEASYYKNSKHNGFKLSYSHKAMLSIFLLPASYVKQITQIGWPSS